MVHRTMTPPFQTFLFAGLFNVCAPRFKSHCIRVSKIPPDTAVKKMNITDQVPASGPNGQDWYINFIVNFKAFILHLLSWTHKDIVLVVRFNLMKPLFLNHPCIHPNLNDVRILEIHAENWTLHIANLALKFAYMTRCKKYFSIFFSCDFLLEEVFMDLGSHLNELMTKKW